MIESVKWSINNRCNLACPYCFADNYFEENSFEEKCRIIDKLYSMGIEYLDFFGKEPLLNDTIFKLLDYMYETGQLFHISFITNGKNLLKYKDKIIGYPCIEQFAVSYDFLSSRSFNINPEILKDFEKEGIAVEITIDLQKGNIDRVSDFIKQRYAEQVFLNPIVPMGKNQKSAKEVMITLPELLDLIRKLQNVVSDDTSGVYINVPFRLSTGFDTSKFKNDKIDIGFEPKCSCGIDHAFIASNGYIYGCNSAAYVHSSRCCNFLETDIEKIKNIIKGDWGKRECLMY